MSNHETYIFFLCLAVFVMMVAVFSFLITLLVRAQIKLIRAGTEDENIVKERQNVTKRSKACVIIEKVLSILLFVALLSALIFSIYINVSEDKLSDTVSSVRVVKSTSMSFKRESNKYLFENDLNDQIQMFDIIRVHPLPAEEELELYDIVLYETADGAQIIHRIVGIEEPNEKHPDTKYFLMQGDAVHNPDVFPMLYSQFEAIYLGERLPNVGSFVMFMQSPSGWLCVLLVFAFLICEPLTFKFIQREQDKRYAVLCPAPIDADPADGESEEVLEAERLEEVSDETDT